MNPRVLRQAGSSEIVLICDHASNYIPSELSGLGLAPGDLERHIAWDIGAAGVVEELSEIFDATAVFSAASRLVADCNRNPTAADCMPLASHGVDIPGNRQLDFAAKGDRIQRWFQPYHDAVEAVLSEREGNEKASIVVSIHSMTPSLGGQDRPWPIAVSSHIDRRLTDPILAALREPGDIAVGDNQPYDLDPATDYSVPFHAIRRGLLHVQVEFRQDVISQPAGQRRWAKRFARALKQVL